MNFARLKADFRRYLKEQGIVLDRSSNVNFGSASIFEYKEEFKEFLSTKHDIDLDEISFEIPDIDDLKIKNGRIALPDDSKDVLDGENLAIEIFNELLREKDFKDMLDADGNNKLNKDEILSFLEFAGENNEDEEKVSFNDLFEGYNKAQDGDYEISEDLKAKVAEKESAKEAAASRAGGGGGGGGGTSYSSSSSNKTTTAKTTEKSYDKMTLEELTAKRGENQATLDTQRTELNQTYTADKTATEEAKTAYDEAISKDNIDPALKASRDENVQNIATQDNLIADLKVTINDLDAQITAKDVELTMLITSKNALNEALASIGTAEAENPTDTELQTEITEKRAGIEQQLNEIATREAALNQELQTLKTKKEESQTNLDTAQTTLTTLEEQKTTIDEQILQSCNEETKLALENYNKARQNAKDNAQKGEENIKTTQAELAKIDSAINDKLAKQIKNEFSVGKKDMFSNDSELELNFIEGETNMSYGVIGPKDADPNEELPVLIFFHGSGEIGSPGGLQHVMKENFMGDLENFRGYVICPMLSSGESWWSESTMANVGQVLDSFGQTHAIDYDNISLSGHSIGGEGVVYAAENNRFEQITGIELQKIAPISGTAYHAYSNLGDYEVRTYRGQHDSVGITPWYKYAGDDAYHEIKGADHGMADMGTFNLDEDGNGRSDIFEWMFEE